MDQSKLDAGKGFFLIRMNSQNAVPGFMTTSYLGVLEEITDEAVILSNVCNLLEQAVSAKDKNGQPTIAINLQYSTNSMISSGELRFPKSAIAFSRDVDDADELLKGYHESFESLRLERINIKRAGHVASVPPVGRA